MRITEAAPNHVGSAQNRMIIFFIILALQGNDVAISEVGYYSRLSPQEVSLSSKNGLYVLDTAIGKLDKFDLKGKWLGSTGRIGEGPGEFRAPKRLDIMGDLVIVFDWPYVHQFSADLSFDSRHVVPKDVSYLSRVKDGWVGIFGLQEHLRQNPTRLIWFSADFSQQNVLSEWQSEQERYPRPSAGFGKDYYNPLESQTIYALNDSRTVAAVHLSGTNKIFGVGIADEQKKFQVIVKDDPIQFDKLWGSRQLSKMEKFLKSMGIKPSIEPWFPETFPVIVGLFPLPNDRFGVRRFSHTYLEDGVPDLLDLYNFNGKVEKEYPLDSINHRLVGVIESDVYIIVYNQSDDVWGVQIVPKQNVVDFVNNNPLPSYELELENLLGLE